MDRTNAPGSVDRRYVDENRNAGMQGTAIVADDRNAVQEELIHLIEGGGLTPSAGNLAQLLQAVETIAVQRALTVPPIGTIWMYDGTGWIDDLTVPGWYACIPENATHGCPNLVDRFVAGGTTAGVTGGSNSYRLTVDQLPSHSHAIDHDHAPFDTDNGGNHWHLIFSGGTQFGGADLTADNYPKEHWAAGATNEAYKIVGRPQAPTRGRTSTTTHTHQIDVPAYVGASGATGAGVAIDNRPAHYAMIFIRRCY